MMCSAATASSSAAPLFVLLFAVAAVVISPVRSLPFPEFLSTPAAIAAANTSASAAAAKSAVCTPSECLIGINALVAGAHASTSYNGTTLLFTLLPGIYTSSSPAFTSSNISSTYFNPSSMSIAPSIGFTASSAPGSSSPSSYVVALLAGVTTYSNTLYQGSASYSPLLSNSTSIPTPSSSSSNISSSSRSSLHTTSSLLLSSGAFVILSSSGSSHLVIYNSLPDLSQLPTSALGSGSGGMVVSIAQSTSCIGGCSSGGFCAAEGKCICSSGFAGNTCNACLPGHYGRSCLPCASSSECTVCEDGISGSGRCLASRNVTVGSSACNCVNGLCSSLSAGPASSSTIAVASSSTAVSTSSSVCACNAGWTTSSNGTLCAACSIGYFLDPLGQCLACDPSCASCSSPLGVCLTCLPTLIPLSNSPTKCTAAPARLTSSTSSVNNGSSSSFVTCPPRTYFNSLSSRCIACDPLCETCFAGTTTSCLNCRTGLGLLNGVCVAVDATSGVCDSNGMSGGWVFDNAKGVCDALPPKCTAGSIDNFNPTSSRSALHCSACLPGTFLVNGSCLESCPIEFVAVGNACVPCDPSCSSCSITPGYCLTCSASTQLSLGGNCINGPTCPTGFFLSTSASTNSTLPASTIGRTCLPCHPDCATCGTTFDSCLTCPSSRPFLLPPVASSSSSSTSSISSSSTCKVTCPSSNNYYDTLTSSCMTCDSSCSTCSAAGSTSCTSCSTSASLRLRFGSCVASNCSPLIADFNVCVSDLVTVSSPAAPAAPVAIVASSNVLPWYFILLILLLLLLLVALIVTWWRKREQQKRKQTTAKFANGLDKKDVELKLRELKLGSKREEYMTQDQMQWARDEQRRVDDAEVEEDYREMERERALERSIAPLPLPQEVLVVEGASFVIGDCDSPTASTFSFSPHQHHATPAPLRALSPSYDQRREISRWSDSTTTTAARWQRDTVSPVSAPGLPPFRLVAQSTGASGFSMVTASSSDRHWGNKNPFAAQL